MIPLPQKLKDRLVDLRARLRAFGSKSYFDSLRNIHQGKRGFVIGNGPSLKLPDLDRIKDEVTIASNRVYLAFDQVQWRPTYFTIADPQVWRKYGPELHEFFEQVHIPSCLKPWPGITIKKRQWYPLPPVPMPFDGKPCFSNNFADGAHGGCTVTFDNLQLAVHLGMNPIYLIGCDHYYEGESGTGAEGSVYSKGEQNHFISGYRKVGEKAGAAPIPKMTNAYVHAREYGKANGIQIFNATRGGHLEVFPRVDFDSLF